MNYLSPIQLTKEVPILKLRITIYFSSIFNFWTKGVPIYIIKEAYFTPRPFLLKLSLTFKITFMDEKTEMMGNFLKMLIKTSGQDVLTPQPLLDKKEDELLKSSKAKDIWITVQIDTAGLSEEEIIGIAMMLLYKNLKTTQLLDIDSPKMFVSEILDFLKEHPEYTLSKDEIDSKGIINDFLGN